MINNIGINKPRASARDIHKRTLFYTIAVGIVWAIISSMPGSGCGLPSLEVIIGSVAYCIAASIVGFAGLYIYTNVFFRILLCLISSILAGWAILLLVMLGVVPW